MGVRELCDGFVGALGARQGAMRPFLMLFLLGGQLPRAPSSGGIETSDYPSTDYSVKTKKNAPSYGAFLLWSKELDVRLMGLVLVLFLLHQSSRGRPLHRCRYASISAEQRLMPPRALV